MKQPPALELTNIERDVLLTHAAAWRADVRAAITRGKLVRFPQGRKKRWPIPRPWRFQLSPEDEARVLAAMVLHDVRVRGGAPRPAWQAITSTAMEARALADLERSLVLRLNDRDCPLAKDEIERLYDLARTAEHAFGLPGMDERLARLDWERDQFLFRRMTDAVIDSVAKPGQAPMARGKAVEPDRAPTPALSQSPARTALRNQITPENNQAVAEQSPCAPPDDFRDAICPPSPMEAPPTLQEIETRKRRLLAQFNLSESTTRRLDNELARAGDLAAQLAVLDRWLGRMARARTMTETIVAGRDAATDVRGSRPRPREEKPRLTIDPRYK